MTGALCSALLCSATICTVYVIRKSQSSVAYRATNVSCLGVFFGNKGWLNVDWHNIHKIVQDDSSHLSNTNIIKKSSV